MARTSTARRQKRNTKASAQKVVQRRAMPASIKAPNTKRLAHTARSDDHHQVPVINQPSSARQSNSVHHQTQHQPSQVVLSYNHGLGTAMQAFQLLLALPFLSLQMWQSAVLGGRRLEAKR
jgi:hypothetical protein